MVVWNDGVVMTCGVLPQKRENVDRRASRGQEKKSKRDVENKMENVVGDMQKEGVLYHYSVTSQPRWLHLGFHLRLRSESFVFISTRGREWKKCGVEELSDHWYFYKDVVVFF